MPFSTFLGGLRFRASRTILSRHLCVPRPKARLSRQPKCNDEFPAVGTLMGSKDPPSLLSGPSVEM